MSWGAPRLRWLNTTEIQLNQSLDKLLDSNPIISSKQTNRPNDASDLRERIKKEVLILFISRYLKPDLYASDVLFQKGLETFITELLSKSHYLFMLRQPPNQSFTVSEKGFWFPASYYICGWKMEDGRLKYIEMRFLGRKFFYEEFYDFGIGSRHPALVIKCFSPNLFFMIPFSNEIEFGGQYKSMTVRYKTGYEERQNAIYGYYFKVSTSMLDERSRDYKGRRISNPDFSLIVDEVRNISRDF